MLGSHPRGTLNTLAAVLARYHTCGRHRPGSRRWRALAGLLRHFCLHFGYLRRLACPQPTFLWCKTLNSGRMGEPPERRPRSGRLQLAVTTSDCRFRAALALLGAV
jgi:hypothetical protein